MKKRFLLATATTIFLLPFLAISQVIEWQNTIGGGYNDQIYAVHQTMDGGYILGGYSDSNISGDKTENNIDTIVSGQTTYDYWIVKIDTAGIIEWQNTIGGSQNDILTSIQQTTDGGYILGGYSDSDISGDKTEDSKGWSDYWIVKTDATGNIQWQKTIGGNKEDNVYSIKQTSDGGYIVGGYSDSNISGDKTEINLGGHDYWLVKTDSSGTIQWENTIGGNGYEYFGFVQQTSDGGYIVGGYSDSNISGDKTENSNGGVDYWIIKTDAIGNIQWQNTIGGNADDQLFSLKQTDDDGYILGGSSKSIISGDKTEGNIGNHDYWIVKIDAFGIIQWQNTIGGNSGDYHSFIKQTADGGYFLGGNSYSGISGDKTENCLGWDDYWIVKTDALGVIQWQKTIGGSVRDEIQSIEQTSDGGYILGGSSNSNISGDKTENCNGQSDYWIVKILDQQTSLSETHLSNDNLLLYPNPANSTITIETGMLQNSECRIYITDVAGRTIFSKAIAVASTKHSIDISAFSQGIYFVQLQAGENISRGRFVKE